MAVCSVTRFTISRGVNNEFFFIVKANGSLSPMVIAPTDTFTVKLVSLYDNTTIALLKSLTVVDPTIGKLRLFITADEANKLTFKRGGAEDRYYLKPTYKLLLEAVTEANGSFVAKIGNVYVG